MQDVSVHGIYHLLQWNAASLSFRMPGPDWCEITPFWHQVAASGDPVLTLDVPFSLTKTAPDLLTEVIGWGNHEGAWSASRPAGLLEDLLRRHGRGSQVREVPGLRSDPDLRRELAGLVADVARRVDVIEDLGGRTDWRLFLAVFSETHRAGHWFWGDRGTGVPLGGIKAVLAAFDAVLPRLRRLLGPEDHLAVFSLQGMGPAQGSHRFGEAIRDYFDPAGIRRTLDPVFLLRRLVPQAVLRQVVRRLPEAAYNRLNGHYANAGRDWSRVKTIVNPLEHIIYVSANVADGGGLLSQKAAHLDWLRAQFEGIRTPEGRPLVEQIFEPGLANTGPRGGLLPDLIVKPAPIAVGTTILTRDGNRLRHPDRSWPDGQHLPLGFYIRTGPGIPPNSIGSNISGERLASYLCALAGIELGPRP